MEFVRRNDVLAAGLTLPQVISLVMVAGGSAWLLTHRREPVASPSST